MATTNNVFYKSSCDGTKGYKYIAFVRESPNTLAKMYVSNNLSALKSYVYNVVVESYPTAKCDVYCYEDMYVDCPIYKCWRVGDKTFSKNNKRR